MDAKSSQTPTVRMATDYGRGGEGSSYGGDDQTAEEGSVPSWGGFDQTGSGPACESPCGDS